MLFTRSVRVQIIGMIPKFIPIGLVAVLAGLTACQKNDAPKAGGKAGVVELVKPTEQSRNFAAVNRQLELGGSLYAYVDVEGDVVKLLASVQQILEQAAKTDPQAAQFAKHDLKAIATTLGLTDIKAMGVSSVPEGDGYFRNRMFFYTGGERHGLMASLGGKAVPFKHVNLAPADTAFYAEAEVDLPVVYRTIKDVVSQVAGEPVGNKLEASLKQAGEAAALSVLDLIYGLKGHSAMVVRMDSTKPMTFPGPSPVVTPGFSLLLCVEGIGPVLEPTLAKLPILRRSDSGTRHIYELAMPLPVEGIKPVLVVDGSNLYFSTTLAFHDECRSQKAGLADDPEFKRALAHVGTEGNGLNYVTPRFFDELRKIETLNPNLPEEAKSKMNFIFSQLPKLEQPLVAVRTNLPDGILVRSHLNRSHKQDIAMATAYNPITVGILAAMAIPAFQKVRASSQEKAVMNNLRMLHAAAEQHYLETGKTTAKYEDLVGDGPNRYIKKMISVAGEDYSEIEFKLDQPLTIQLPDGREFSYPD